MTQKLKNILLTFMAVGVLVAPAAVAVPAGALSPNVGSVIGGLCEGVDQAGGDQLSATPSGTATCNTATKDNDAITKLLQTVVNILSVVVGIIAVIMIVVAGFRYITSGGESSKVSGAKNAIIYALVGLIIVALAQIIVHFVINRTLGSYSA